MNRRTGTALAALLTAAGIALTGAPAHATPPHATPPDNTVTYDYPEDYAPAPGQKAAADDPDPLGVTVIEASDAELKAREVKELDFRDGKNPSAEAKKPKKEKRYAFDKFGAKKVVPAGTDLTMNADATLAAASYAPYDFNITNTQNVSGTSPGWGYARGRIQGWYSGSGTSKTAGIHVASLTNYSSKCIIWGEAGQTSPFDVGRSGLQDYVGYPGGDRYNYLYDLGYDNVRLDWIGIQAQDTTTGYRDYWSKVFDGSRNWERTGIDYNYSAWEIGSLITYRQIEGHYPGFMWYSLHTSSGTYGACMSPSSLPVRHFMTHA
jgi:hypothetical protein